MTFDPASDRRTADRLEPKGSAILVARTWSRRGRVANLSISGMVISVDDAVPPCTDAVAVELRLDGADQAWLQLDGHVVRSDAGGIAVEFDRTPPAFASLIAETARASHTNARRISVVLVDPEVPRRARLAEAFRAVGCDLLDVGTPLEAIVRLGESHFEPDLIAIADSQPAVGSEQLRAFVERAHPAVQLVRIGDVTSGATELASADAGNDLVARVRRLLGHVR